MITTKSCPELDHLNQVATVTPGGFICYEGVTYWAAELNFPTEMTVLIYPHTSKLKAEIYSAQLHSKHLCTALQHAGPTQTGKPNGLSA